MVGHHLDHLNASNSEECNKSYYDRKNLAPYLFDNELLTAGGIQTINHNKKKNDVGSNGNRTSLDRTRSGSMSACVDIGSSDDRLHDQEVDAKGGSGMLNRVNSFKRVSSFSNLLARANSLSSMNHPTSNKNQHHNGSSKKTIAAAAENRRLSKLQQQKILSSQQPLQVIPSWRLRDRMKTVGVGLVMALNVGTDPPDLTKPHPCAKLQCWMDPSSTSSARAREKIGERLEAQYARWQQQRAVRPLKYRRALDPTVEDVRALCLWLRRQARQERVLLHYNGHGVPRPTANGEIWVFDKNHTEYIPLSITDLRQWMGTPGIIVLDCSSAGILIPFVTAPLNDNNTPSAAPTEQKHYRNGNNNYRGEVLGARARIKNSYGMSTATNAHLDIETAASQWVRDTIVLCPTSEGEWLPMHPDYPADIFTSCLTTPIKMALRWFVRRNPQSMGGLQLEAVDSIPGKANERKTPLGELNWIFTSVTDSIAWNILPTPLFQRLFRQDLLVASMFRNFLLADRILRSLDCTPQSYPPLPPGVADHPLWQAWDLACETCLFGLLKDGILGNHLIKVTIPQSISSSTLFNTTISTGGDGRIVNDTREDNINENMNSNSNNNDNSDGVLNDKEKKVQGMKQKKIHAATAVKNVKQTSNISSPFFEEQLTAFEVWLEYATIHKIHLQNGIGNNTTTLVDKPEQLPVVLQVLLSQVHRIRALRLLRSFLNLGNWAVNLSLSLGIFPYVMKLLQSPEYKSLLVSIWASILAFDSTCQVDLVKDGALPHFIQHLTWGLNIDKNNNKISNGNNTASKTRTTEDIGIGRHDIAKQRTLASFIIAVTCFDHPQGQNECIRLNLIGNLCTLLSSYEKATAAIEKKSTHEEQNQSCRNKGITTAESTFPAQFRLWLCLCFGNMVEKNFTSQNEAYSANAHLRLFSRIEDESPDVRAAACFTLGCLIGSAPTSSLSTLSIDSNNSYSNKSGINLIDSNKVTNLASAGKYSNQYNLVGNRTPHAGAKSTPSFLASGGLPGSTKPVTNFQWPTSAAVIDVRPTAVNIHHQTVAPCIDSSILHTNLGVQTSGSTQRQLSSAMQTTTPTVNPTSTAMVATTSQALANPIKGFGQAATPALALRTSTAGVATFTKNQTTSGQYAMNRNLNTPFHHEPNSSAGVTMQLQSQLQTGVNSQHTYSGYTVGGGTHGTRVPHALLSGSMRNNPIVPTPTIASGLASANSHSLSSLNPGYDAAIGYHHPVPHQQSHQQQQSTSPQMIATTSSIFNDRPRTELDLSSMYMLMKASKDASSLVRYEATISLGSSIEKYLDAFLIVAEEASVSSSSLDTAIDNKKNDINSSASNDKHKENTSSRTQAIKSNDNFASGSGCTHKLKNILCNDIDRHCLDRFSTVWKTLRSLQHDDPNPVIAQAANRIVSFVHEHLLHIRMDQDFHSSSGNTSDAFRDTNYNEPYLTEEYHSNPRNNGKNLMKNQTFLSPASSERRLNSNISNASSSNLGIKYVQAPIRRVSSELVSPLVAAVEADKNNKVNHTAQATNKNNGIQFKTEYCIPKSKFYEWKKSIFQINDESGNENFFLNMDPLSPIGALRSYEHRRNVEVQETGQKLQQRFKCLAPTKRRRPNNRHTSIEMILEDEDEAFEEEASRKKCELEMKETKMLVTDFKMTSMLKFHPYEDILMVCGSQDRISVWDTGGGSQISSFSNGNPKGSRITTVSWINEASTSLFLVGCDDGSARIWDNTVNSYGNPTFSSDEPDLIAVFYAVPDLVAGQRGSGLVCKWQQSAGKLFAGGNSKYLRCWDLQAEKCSSALETRTDACITCLTIAWEDEGPTMTPSSISSDANRGGHQQRSGGLGPDIVVTGHSDGTLQIFDIRMKQVASQLQSQQKSQQHMLIDGSLSSAASRKQRLTRFREHTSWIVGTSFTGYGLRQYELISGSVNGDIKAWDLRMSISLRTLEVQRSTMTALAVHPKIPLVASGSHAQFIRMLTLDNETLKVIRYHEGTAGHRIGPVSCLEFHPYKPLLAAGATDTIVSLYEPKNPIPI